MGNKFIAKDLPLTEYPDERETICLSSTDLTLIAFKWLILFSLPQSSEILELILELIFTSKELIDISLSAEFKIPLSKSALSQTSEAA
mgnify:CR=1 FL=1